MPQKTWIESAHENRGKKKTTYLKHLKTTTDKYQLKHFPRDLLELPPPHTVSPIGENYTFRIGNPNHPTFSCHEPASIWAIYKGNNLLRGFNKSWDDPPSRSKTPSSKTPSSKTPCETEKYQRFGRDVGPPRTSMRLQSFAAFNGIQRRGSREAQQTTGYQHLGELSPQRSICIYRYVYIYVYIYICVNMHY